MRRHRLRLRGETVRVLRSLDLDAVRAGAARAGSDNAQCRSDDPCPGEYSWFCQP